MNEAKKQLIKNLLNSADKNCTSMTHNIAELGDGNMAEGLVTLYRSGRLDGIVIGAGSMAALVATYHVGKAIINGIKTQKAIRQIANEKEAQTATISRKENIVSSNSTSPTCPPEEGVSPITLACNLGDETIENTHI